MYENSERHSMTTTYIHKVNLGVDMAYNMRHALTEFAQTWKNFTLVLENSSNLKKVFCLFVCFVALRPKSTAMVIAGRSVHLNTLFPGQA